MKTKKPIESLILNLRGQKVILDADLAELYDVPTKRLNEQAKRNANRFPEDFLFQLTKKEAEGVQRSRSQIATASQSRVPDSLHDFFRSPRGCRILTRRFARDAGRPGP